MAKLKQIFCLHKYRRYYGVDVDNRRHSFCIKCGKWRYSKYPIKPTSGRDV